MYDFIMSKKKFYLFIKRIEKSIENENDFLPSNLIDELRYHHLWDLWRDHVRREISSEILIEKRKKALPKFISDATKLLI